MSHYCLLDNNSLTVAATYSTRLFVLLLFLLPFLLLSTSCFSSSSSDSSPSSDSSFAAGVIYVVDSSPPKADDDPPAPPSANRSDIVATSGGSQTAAFGWVQNHAVFGESYAAGVESTSGQLRVRHGFTLGHVLQVPTGVAMLWPETMKRSIDEVQGGDGVLSPSRFREP